METRCMGCMQIKRSGLRCEHCGFDERTANNTHQLPVGTVVGGQYTLGRVLGQGGFGITYIGWDNVMQKRVAVKEYFPSGYAGRSGNSHTVTSYDHQSRHDFENNKRRFLREAESLAKLWDVPQIVKVLRHFEENGTAYIAMEYVEGMDLRKYLKQHRGPLSVEETLSLLGPVIQALSQVHKAELVHRDISPDNIMVMPDGTTKLLDFGAARYVQNANAEQNRNTSTQAILKHGFAPPEQYRTHGALGPWTDVYAMCATIYYCLTGKVLPEAMSRTMDDEQIDWSGLQTLTRRQRAALEKGLEIQPKDRFDSMEALWQQLKPQEPKPAPKKSKKPLLAASAAAILAVALLGINLLPKDSRELSSETEQMQVPEIAVTTEAVTVPDIQLEIESSLELNGVEYGYTEAIQVLSEHDPEEIQWSSSNSQVAQISGNGTITAVGYGSAEITAQYRGQTVGCSVQVELQGNIDCSYREGASGVQITGYYGDLPEHVVLPSEIDGKAVTAIDAFAFRNKEMTTVIIPKGVTSIGNYSFSGCSNLCSVTIPDTVTSIGEYAFEQCAQLDEVVLPEGLTSIANRAFLNCKNLSSITIPDSVTEIGGYAFAGTPWPSTADEELVICGDGFLMKYSGSDAEVEIPASVKHIFMAAFQNCTSLARVTIPESVISIGDNAFENCTGLTEVQFPKSVESIGWNVFSGCTGLTSVVIPGNGFSIRSGMFRKCTGLTDVKIPEGVTAIGDDAFYGCTGLRNVVIPEGVTAIGDDAFYGCTGLRNVVIPEGVTEIGENAFGNCACLKNVSIPQTVTNIQEGSFSGTPWFDSLTEEFVICGDGVLIKYNGSDSHVVIPSSVKMISSAFSGFYTRLENDAKYIEYTGNAYLKQITIPDSVTVIGDYAFTKCTALESVSIPESVTEIGCFAFSDCSELAEVTLLNGVTSIRQDAFRSCKKLKSITFPESITFIGDNAFIGCTNLENATFPECAITIRHWAFQSCNLSSVTISKDCKIGSFGDKADTSLGRQNFTNVFGEQCTVNLYP